MCFVSFTESSEYAFVPISNVRPIWKGRPSCVCGERVVSLQSVRHTDMKNLRNILCFSSLVVCLS